MDKYLVSAIPAEQQVIIDVPEGYLRVSGYVDGRDGDGRMVFSRATEYADTGNTVMPNKHNIPLLQMHIQTPERAMVIARAFVQLAEEMRDWEDDADRMEACEECNCDDCPQYDFCYGDGDDDNG